MNRNTHPHPVAIFAHPDTPSWRVEALARLALTEQHAPLVLHTSVHPWLRAEDGSTSPQADPVERALLGLVARHTASRLWVLLNDTDTDADPWPRWALGTVREWQRVAGRTPSRIRSGTWEQWSEHHVWMRGQSPYRPDSLDVGTEAVVTDGPRKGWTGTIKRQPLKGPGFEADSYVLEGDAQVFTALRLHVKAAQP